MSLFRPGLRLVVGDAKAGLAWFRVRAGGEPILERWEAGTPKFPTGSWSFIRNTDVACTAVDGTPFLYLDLRTPYGESLSEEQVSKALQDALGPRAEKYSLQGWHVTHLEDTNLGSNHRVFASLLNGADGSEAQPWDQCLPFEAALEALGDWVAGKKRHTSFQLVLSRGKWVYSLAYRNAQPYHTIRVLREPREFAAKRLREHREYLRQGQGSAPIPLMVDPGDAARTDWENALGEKGETIPRPSGFSNSPDSGPALGQFGMALAAMRDDFQIHNTLSFSRQDANRRIRLFTRMVKSTLLALALGLAALGAEGIRYSSVRRDLAALRAEAARYGGKVSAIQSLRVEKKRLLDSLSDLRPLWNRPIPMDHVLEAIAKALPPDGFLEGVSLRNGAEGGGELTFRAAVGDWNHIRPFQERLQRAPFFQSVEISDQRKEAEHKRVVFQAACKLESRP